jgi:HPt (histidine-containing phosphotransfer) domain-containing protein
MSLRSMPVSAARAASLPLDGAAIDFVHLSRQSLGDQTLETELLHLFDRQAARIAGELGMPDLTSGARSERSDLAHTLKGSARAVGAWRVADACHELESRLKMCAAPASIDEACAEVRQAVTQARAAIAGLGR